MFPELIAAKKEPYHEALEQAGNRLRPDFIVSALEKLLNEAPSWPGIVWEHDRIADVPTECQSC